MAAKGDLVFMGPPGSGKGTQARLLADRNGWVQLATGDLFRDNLRRRTALGVLADGFMSKGNYVPDDVTIGMVREHLSQQVPSGTRVIFDGFPRTVAQAEILDGLLAESGRRIGRVLLLDVPRAELIDRLAGRTTCSQCQAVYSMTRPPSRPGSCDHCGGVVVSTARPDDSPEVVTKRLEVYDEQTKPVVEHYERKGLLTRVDGVGDVDVITQRLIAAAG